MLLGCGYSSLLWDFEVINAGGWGLVLGLVVSLVLALVGVKSRMCRCFLLVSLGSEH